VRVLFYTGHVTLTGTTAFRGCKYIEIGRIYSDNVHLDASGMREVGRMAESRDMIVIEPMPKVTAEIHVIPSTPIEYSVQHQT
jgi:hypothetical protein